MENLFKVLVVFAVVVSLLVGVKALNREFPVGANAGPVHTEKQQFLGDLSVGGNVAASSTSVSVTLAGTEFNNASTLDYTVNKIGVTLTLPASTTALCNALKVNENRVVRIRHASTTAANIFTIAGGTGFALKTNSTSTSASITGDTDGSNYARLEIRKLVSTDCVAGLEVFTDAL